MLDMAPAEEIQKRQFLKAVLLALPKKSQDLRGVSNGISLLISVPTDNHCLLVLP
jgi:hypothetical protein